MNCVSTKIGNFRKICNLSVIVMRKLHLRKKYFNREDKSQCDSQNNLDLKIVYIRYITITFTGSPKYSNRAIEFPNNFHHEYKLTNLGGKSPLETTTKYFMTFFAVLMCCEIYSSSWIITWNLQQIPSPNQQKIRDSPRQFFIFQDLAEKYEKEFEILKATAFRCLRIK